MSQIARLLGKLIPSISLVLLLVVVTAIILLSAVGIPQSFINKIEEAAKQEGLSLKIDKARLSYSSGLGLIIQNCTLSLEGTPEQQAAIAFTEAELALRVSPLLQGQMKPYLIKVNEGSLLLTDKGQKRLVIKKINISASVTNNDILKVACISPINVQGVQLDIKADVPVDKIYPHFISQEEEPDKSDKTAGEQIAKILEENRDSLNSLHELTLQQEWMLSKQNPEVNLSLNAINKPHCHFSIYFPSCSYENVTIEDLELNAAYANDTIIIHKLTAQTNVSPDKKQKAQINLQGGYDLLDNHLTFTLDCKLPLFNIIHDLLDSADIDILQNIPTSSDKDSDLRLEGDVYLHENMKLKQANLIGYVMQKELHLGDCHINELELSFFLNEDNFSIDKARIKMDEGELSAQSQLRDGRGTITVKSNLTAQQVFSLKDGLQLAKEASLLPEDLQLAHPIEIEAIAQIDTPDKHKGSQPFIHYIPHIEQLDISLSTQEISYGEHDILDPQITLLFEDLRGSEKQLIKKLQAHISAEQVKSIIDGKELQAQALVWEGEVSDIHQKEDKSWQAALAQSKLSLYQLQYGSNHIGSAQISLTEASKINYPTTDKNYWQSLKATAQISDILYQECAFKSFDLQLNADSLEHFNAQLGLLIDSPNKDHIQLDIERITKENISLNNISVHVPTDIINKILPKDSLKEYNIALLDSTITAKGQAELQNKEDGLRLQSLQLDFNIPQLERGTSGIPALADKRNVLGIEGALALNYDDARQLQFNIPHFNITSKSGDISGSARSRQEGKVTIDLTSTMMPDTINELIGDISTHRIIRDFEFNPKSKVHLNKAQVEIDYRNGFDILVHSDVIIEDIQLVLGHYKTILDKDKKPTVEEELNKESAAKLYSHITHGHAQLIVDVKMGKKKEGDEHPPIEKSLISINDITLQFDNKPWLSHKKIKGGVSNSTLTSKSVVLDTKENSVQIYEAKGKIYPDYAIGTFYYQLRKHLQLLEQTQPVDIESAFCQFPIMETSKVPMAGNIKISSKNLVNLLFDKHKIPLNQFTGFVSFAKKSVYLDRLNAYSWNGVLDGKLRLGILKNDVSYDGELTATGLNLHEIGKSFGIKQEKALCSGKIRYQSPSSKLNDLKAYGNIEILNGDLLKLRVFSPVSELVSDVSQLTDIQKNIIDSEKESQDLNLFQRISSGASRATAKSLEYAHDGMKWVGGLFGSTANNIPSANHILKYDLQNATCQFEIRDGHFIAQQLKAYGSNLSLLMNISLRLEDKYVNANIRPNISSLLGITLSPITSISNYILDINVFGPVDDMDWKIKLQTGSTDNIKEIMNKATFRKKASTGKN